MYKGQLILIQFTIHHT